MNLALLLIAPLLVVAIALLVYLIQRVRRMHRTLRDFDKRNAGRSALQDGLRKQFDESVWPQVESLIGIYRLIDGVPVLPPMRGWAASPDFIRHLLRHIEDSNPATILECGSGTSTIAMAHMLRDRKGAHIYSLENHPLFASQLESELRKRDLSHVVSVIVAPLSERKYAGFDQAFQWYDLTSASLPDYADMLVVDGPWSKLNQLARYPAGPELLPRLAPHAHIFVDDANRRDEGELGSLWRRIYPNLGFRKLAAEKGAWEMVFLDHQIKQFMPTGMAEPAESPSARIGEV